MLTRKAEMTKSKRQVIVAQFENRSEAQKALKTLNKTIKNQNVELQQGALVTRAPDGILEIEKLNDNTLSQLTTDAFNLTTFVAMGSAKLVVSTVQAGFGLFGSSLRRGADLASSVAAVTVNRARSFTGGDKPLRRIGGSLKPGAAAIMVVVDADHADAVAAVLNGGPGKIESPAGAEPAGDEPASPHDLPM
jgi:uncharacterized membrane protein